MRSRRHRYLAYRQVPMPSPSYRVMKMCLSDLLDLISFMRTCYWLTVISFIKCLHSFRRSTVRVRRRLLYNFTEKQCLTHWTRDERDAVMSINTECLGNLLTCVIVDCQGGYTGRCELWQTYSCYSCPVCCVYTLGCTGCAFLEQSSTESSAEKTRDRRTWLFRQIEREQKLRTGADTLLQ